MNILNKVLFNGKINKSYEQISDGEFSDFFIKVTFKSKRILIIGEIGTGTGTLGESLLILNENYKLYDFIKDISKSVFPINESPYIVIIQEKSIDRALSIVSDYKIDFDYAVYLSSAGKIGTIKALN